MFTLLFNSSDAALGVTCTQFSTACFLGNLRSQKKSLRFSSMGCRRFWAQNQATSSSTSESVNVKSAYIIILGKGLRAVYPSPIIGEFSEKFKTALDPPSGSNNLQYEFFTEKKGKGLKKLYLREGWLLGVMI